MTYKDMYDEMLEELYYSKDIPSWMFVDGSAARTMEENDPTMYRCGFADWLDGISHDDIQCPECNDRDIDSETISNAGQDDTVQCSVCAGTHFQCQNCDEVKPKDEESEDENVCAACAVTDKETEHEG